MIRLFKVLMAPGVPQAVNRVLLSGYVGQGPKVEEFEEKLAEFLGTEVLTVNSGTSALSLALHLLGVGPGDEVISTAQTCAATNAAIAHSGATIVWADVDAFSGNILPSSVGHAISDKTKAIMAVDWAGRPCQYDELNSFGIPVVEDAAHAIGSTFSGKHVAQVNPYVCFSFQAIKHLTTGDGGAIKVPEEQLDRARRLRWFGLNRRTNESFRCKQDIPEIGFKYHMNDIAAAIGVENLTLLRSIVDRHVEHATYLADGLASHDDVAVPASHALRHSSCWFLPILVPSPVDFIANMAAQGVEVSPVHYRNDKLTAFKAVSRSPVPLTGLDYFSAHHVGIPCGWWLNQADLDKVIEAVEKSL